MFRKRGQENKLRNAYLSLRTQTPRRFSPPGPGESIIARARANIRSCVERCGGWPNVLWLTEATNWNQKRREIRLLQKGSDKVHHVQGGEWRDSCACTLRLECKKVGERRINNTEHRRQLGKHKQTPSHSCSTHSKNKQCSCRNRFRGPRLYKQSGMLNRAGLGEDRSLQGKLASYWSSWNISAKHEDEIFKITLQTGQHSRTAPWARLARWLSFGGMGCDCSGHHIGDHSQKRFPQQFGLLLHHHVCCFTGTKFSCEASLHAAVSEGLCGNWPSVDQFAVARARVVWFRFTLHLSVFLLERAIFCNSYTPSKTVQGGNVCHRVKWTMTGFYWNLKNIHSIPRLLDTHFYDINVWNLFFDIQLKQNSKLMQKKKKKYSASYPRRSDSESRFLKVFS